MTIEIDQDSGTSWGAIFAGAACAASLSFILLILGFGLGISVVSPWSNTSASLTAIGISSIVWVAFTQILASGLGGYIAGRLRVRWPGVHVDEVYFRDTAHGLITWAIATLVAAVLLTSAVTTVIGRGFKAGMDVAGEVVNGTVEGATGMASSLPGTYFIDTLLRTAPVSDSDRADETVRKELTSIFLRSLAAGEFSSEDEQYVASVISRYTGLSEDQAQARITQVFANAQQAAMELETATKEATDAARVISGTSALWMFIALLCGAFFASLMAMFGGRQRDSGSHAVI